MSEKIDTQAYLDLLNGALRDKFHRFFRLLTEYNEKFNLTAVTREDEVFDKHFLDSVAGEKLFPERALVAEVGSGAGFPSLPLKLLRDDLSFTLIESVGKKCSFLNAVIDALSLKGVTVVNARAEELARLPAYRERFQIVCARAVAKLNTLSEYCLPLCRLDGAFIAYKTDCDMELREAERAIALLGGAPIKTYSYSILNGNRTLVEIKKIKSTPALYPRGQGKERKCPL